MNQMNGINAHAQPYQKTWVDRVVDVIIGEEPTVNSKYALICENCFNHNGLALAEEFERIRMYI
jgi:endoplasmic reticulum junction formation protein lunapark